MSRADIKAELEAFIKSGKATSEVNSGNFVTTHIDPLKVAEHFYEQAEKDLMEKAEKWLSEHCEEHPIYPESIVVDFKRAMSELK